MPAPFPASTLRGALSLGLAAGCLEVALRARPRLGLGLGEMAAWLAVATALSLGLALAAALPAALLGRRFPRVPGPGLVLGVLVCLHAALAWRFELFVNAFGSDPRLLGGLGAILLASAALTWFLDRPLRRLRGRLDLAALFIAAMAASVAVLRTLPRPVVAAPAGPNVLLVTLDTVRADALEPWGDANDTPTIARLAREGVVFEQAISTAPLTESSHLAMLSGLEPTTTGVVSNGTPIGAQPALISHAFQRAGLATGGFVAGFPLSGRWGWAQGFDVYDDDFGAMPGLHRLSLVKAWDQLTLPAHTLRERTAELVIDRALGWIERQGDRRWLAWVHLFDPHGPYEPPEAWRPTGPPPRDGAPLELPPYWPPGLRSVTSTGWLTEAYLGEVRWTDHALGVLLEALAARGQLEDTLILVVGDHGESLTEHGYLFDHGDDLFDPSLRVPLLLWHPGILPAGTRVPCQVSTVGVAPTLLDAAGLDPLTPARDGASLLPLAQGAEACAEGEVFATTVAGRLMERPPLDYAVRGRGRKLIGHEGGRSELYDLCVDPGETVDMAAERPAEASALRAILDAHVSGSEILAPSFDPATRAALQALGYLE
ncbi:MAG: sulfatase [Pseudomonadota bacterium]